MFHISTVLFSVLILICSPLIVTARISFISKTKEQSANNRVLQKRAASATPELVQKPDVLSYIVQTDIKYRYAKTSVCSTVINSASVAQEINFSVTLPDSAFISGFSMTIKNKTYQAHVKQKEEAKEEYDQAKNAGQTAAHVEVNERDSNIFTVSVNIEAKSNVGFNLTYEQLLQRTLGVYENQLNVNPGQVVEVLNVTVNIEESAPLTVLEVLNLNKAEDGIEYAPHKSTVVSKPVDNKANILWNPSHKEQELISTGGMKGVLVVRYDIDRQIKSNQILVDKKFFAHFIAPTNLQVLSKYVIFILDISGSMTRKKMTQLKEAMNQILSEVAEEDYFSIVLFSQDIKLWSLTGTIKVESDQFSSVGNKENTKYVIPATNDNIQRAIAFINILGSETTTNIIGALRTGIRLAEFAKKVHPENEPIMFFLTDGQANVEESNSDVIAKKITALNQNVGCTIFSLALGNDLDYNLLDVLAKSNGGFAKKIYVASDTAKQLTNFYKQISSPLMSNVSLKYDPIQIKEETITKTDFTNYFQGSELVVAGKLSDNNTDRIFDVEIEANYKTCDECKELPNVEKVVVDEKTTSDSGRLERLWAYMKVKQLLDMSLTNSTKSSSFKEEALALSLKYSFVTPLTSLVVVKPNETKYSKVKSVDDLGVHGPVPAAAKIVRSRKTSSSGGTARKSSRLFARGHYDESPTIPPPTTTEDTRFTVNDIEWLNKTGNILTLPNSEYLVVTRRPNLTYENCTASKYGPGYCKHMENCLLADIITSYQDYLPYKCIIENKYAGVCCPETFEGTR